MLREVELLLQMVEGISRYRAQPNWYTPGTSQHHRGAYGSRTASYWLRLLQTSVFYGHQVGIHRYKDLFPLPHRCISPSHNNTHFPFISRPDTIPSLRKKANQVSHCSISNRSANAINMRSFVAISLLVATAAAAPQGYFENAAASTQPSNASPAAATSTSPTAPAKGSVSGSGSANGSLDDFASILVGSISS